MNARIALVRIALSFIMFMLSGRIHDLWCYEEDGEKALNYVYTWRRFDGYDNTTVVSWRTRLFGDGWSGRYRVAKTIRLGSVPALVRQIHNTTGELISFVAGVRLEEYSRKLPFHIAMYVLLVFGATKVISLIFTTWLARHLFEWLGLVIFVLVFIIDEYAVPVYPSE